jgi:hypothetical protein
VNDGNEVLLSNAEGTNLEFEGSNEPDITSQLFNDYHCDIETLLLTSGDRYEDINSIATEICKLYQPIEQRKNTIKSSLISFKEKLLHSDSSISDCFKALRSNVDSSVQLELIAAGNEVIKMNINNFSSTEVNEDVKSAVLDFNNCLNQCQKFEGEKELKEADIKFRLDELQLMPLTKDGQLLYDELNSIPSHIDQILEDIGVLQQEIHKAKDLLRPQ